MIRKWVVMEYQVDLAAFRGPLDLLLYLVKKDEVDILDIPIGQITEQYVGYLKTIQHIDVERAGEFLVMAATLMEIKSRLLLPRDPEAPEEAEDPRLELVKQLVEYRRYKDAANLLESRAEVQGSRFARTAPPEPDRDPELQPVRAVEIWDLVSAFGRMLREAEALQPSPIIVDDTPQYVYQALVRQQLKQHGRCTFRNLFHPPWTRGRLVGLFLALLEMIRRFELDIDQSERFGEIWVQIRTDTPSDEADTINDEPEATASDENSNADDSGWSGSD